MNVIKIGRLFSGRVQDENDKEQRGGEVLSEDDIKLLIVNGFSSLHLTLIDNISLTPRPLAAVGSPSPEKAAQVAVLTFAEAEAGAYR